MPFTNPFTAVAFQKFLASDWNTYIRDNLNFLNTEQPAWVKVNRTTAVFTKNANTTLSDVTGLSFAIAANETWLFWIALYYSSGTTPDLKFTFTVPSGCTGSQGFVGALNSTSASITVTTVIPAAGSAQVATISGLAINSTTAGTIQLQAAQNVSDASDSTIFANSHLLAVRIP